MINMSELANKDFKANNINMFQVLNENMVITNVHMGEISAKKWKL